MPGMGGIPGLGGGKKTRGRQAPQRKVKGKSGNPAKRAAQERAAAARAAGQSVPGPSAPGSAFGVGSGAGSSSPTSTGPGGLELPPDLEKYLGR
jgi:signal recognition particle subunit SRP54